MNRSFFITAILCIHILFLLSCKTKHETINTGKNHPVEDYYNLMKENQFRFNTLSLKFNAEAQSGDENNSFSGNIYIVKDSLIWISVQKLSIEVARLLITTDSVKMLDRLNKIYYYGDFKILQDIIKLQGSFIMLQAFFTGNADVSIESTDVTTAQTKNYVILQINKRKNTAKTGDSLRQEIRIDTKNYKIIKNSITEKKSELTRLFECEYSGFFQVNEQLFPQKINFLITVSDTTRGNIIFSRVSPDKKETFPFNVPATYEHRKY